MVTGQATSARELIEQGNRSWPDMPCPSGRTSSDHVFPHGYQTVKRFVRNLRGSESPQAVRIILTAASAAAISSNAGRGAGGSSGQRNNEHRAENQPESHDLNYGGLEKM